MNELNKKSIKFYIKYTVFLCLIFMLTFRESRNQRFFLIFTIYSNSYTGYNVFFQAISTFWFFFHSILLN